MTGIQFLAEQCKDNIFRRGRLLDRLFYGYYFEKLPRLQVLSALKAYQNIDGGFGNGLEPDILCPNSSAIATETALFYIDMLDARRGSIVEDILYWVKHHIKQDGSLYHPPVEFENYPYQPWWNNKDEWRSLAIIGQLLRLNSIKAQDIAAEVNELANSFATGEKIKFYDYPYYLYTYALNGAKDPSIEHLLRQLPQFLEDNHTHFPLFSRYWYWLIPEVPADLLEMEQKKVVSVIEKNHLIENPYPELPVWDVPFTLDALVILKRFI